MRLLFWVFISFLFFINNSFADFARGLAAYEAEDYETAFQEWSSSAESGDLAAMRNLGHMFRWGKGVEKNISRAEYWYHRAAVSGFDKAQFNLAILYLNGDGVPKNEEEALKWLELASKQGHEEAREKLEEIKQQKIITPPPLTESKELPLEEKAPLKETKTVIAEAAEQKPETKPLPIILEEEPVTKKLLVHLSSYNHREPAVFGWKQMMKKIVGFERFDMEIKEVEIKDKGKMFRLFAKGDEEDAINLCKKLKSQKEYCLVYDQNGKVVF